MYNFDNGFIWVISSAFRRTFRCRQHSEQTLRFLGLVALPEASSFRNELFFVKYLWQWKMFDVHTAVHLNIISIVKPTRCTIVSNLFYFGMTFTCFGRSFRPSSGVQDCTYSNRHMSNRYCCLLAPSRQQYLFWHVPVAVCTVLNPWWWTERPSEACRASFQNKINLTHWCILLVLL